ncbi:MAG: NAD-binding protein [Dehalococcoidia bacterium]
MDILIYGCGRLTNMLLPPLLQEGHRIAVLGPDPDCLGKLPDVPQIEAILTPEPLMQDYLQQGGVSDTDVFLALSEDDHSNLLVAQIAQHIFNVPSVICHLDSPHLQNIYRELGLRVVGPSGDLLQHIQQGIGV